MRSTWVATTLWLVVASCTITSQQVRTSDELRSGYVLGTDRSTNAYGLWSTRMFLDDDSLSYDTLWTLQMKDPQSIAYDDRFLLVRNKKGKSVIMSTAPDGTRVWKSTKSEERYQELRTELAVPESLILQEIK